MKNEITKLAKKYKRVQSIMKFVNVETLTESFKKQPDSVEKERYGENLETNIKELYRRMKAFSYFPQRINGNLKMGNMGVKKEFKILRIIL
jgi:biotin synthase-like enzyme